MHNFLKLFFLSQSVRYCILLWLSIFLFFTVSISSGVFVYQAYRHSKVLKNKEKEKLQLYMKLKEKLETQEEYINILSEPEFLEHMSRERMQFVGEDELVFRFE